MEGGGQGGLGSTGAAGGNYKGWGELFGLPSSHERRAQRKAKRLARAAAQFASLGTGHYTAPGLPTGSGPGALAGLEAARVYAIPGSTPNTVPSPTPRPSTGSVLGDLIASVPDVLQAVLAYLSTRRQTRDGGGMVPFPYPVPTDQSGSVAQLIGFNPYAGGVPNVPSVQTGSIWGTIGSALGQVGLSALGQLGSFGPQAFPGGASTGIVPGGYSPMMPSVVPTVTPTTVMGRPRMPQVFVSPYGRPARHLGMPIAWSGDIAAVKRLKRAYSRIGRAVGHSRRGGGRFR